MAKKSLRKNALLPMVNSIATRIAHPNLAASANGLENTLVSRAKGFQLPTRSQPPALTAEAMATLQEGLATCRSKRGLTPEANAAVVSLCAEAHSRGWTAEQLLVAVKNACYTSPEIAHLTTTSERDAFLAKIVSACIKEYYKGNAAG